MKFALPVHGDAAQDRIDSNVIALPTAGPSATGTAQKRPAVKRLQNRCKTAAAKPAKPWRARRDSNSGPQICSQEGSGGSVLGPLLGSAGAVKNDRRGRESAVERLRLLRSLSTVADRFDLGNKCQTVASERRATFFDATAAAVRGSRRA
ncbi:MAG: hypothetical protein ABSC22_05670 [Roseiarcus sp.]